MKRCPSCQRTYEDNAQAFCFTDGARLVEDSNPAYDKTMVAPPPTTPAQPEQPPPYYPQSGQTGPTPPYSTQGNQSPSWPQQPSGQSGQQGWPQPQAPAPQQTPSWGTPQTPPPFQQAAPFAAPQSAEGKRRGLAITSLIFGILSIQNALFMRLYLFRPYSPVRVFTLLMAFIGLMLGAIALILSLTNPTRHAARGAAIAAIITTFLSLFIIIILRSGLYY